MQIRNTLLLHLQTNDHIIEQAENEKVFLLNVLPQ